MDYFDEQDEEDEPRRRLTADDVQASLCRTVAQRTLQRFGIKNPPVPVDVIAQQLGCTIRVCTVPDGVDARLVSSATGKIIEVAASHPRVRQRFSIAHEIGHQMLGHRHGESDAAEAQANLFAGALLVPRAWLAKDIGQYPTVAALAARYDVSTHVILIAAKDARLLNRLR